MHDHDDRRHEVDHYYSGGRVTTRAEEELDARAFFLGVLLGSAEPTKSRVKIHEVLLRSQSRDSVPDAHESKRWQNTGGLFWCRIPSYTIHPGVRCAAIFHDFHYYFLFSSPSMSSRRETLIYEKKSMRMVRATSVAWWAR